jgi:hypothetical protein
LSKIKAQLEAVSKNLKNLQKELEEVKPILSKIISFIIKVGSFFKSALKKMGFFRNNADKRTPVAILNPPRFLNLKNQKDCQDLAKTLYNFLLKDKSQAVETFEKIPSEIVKNDEYPQLSEVLETVMKEKELKEGKEYDASRLIKAINEIEIPDKEFNKISDENPSLKDLLEVKKDHPLSIKAELQQAELDRRERAEKRAGKGVDTERSDKGPGPRNR